MADETGVPPRPRQSGNITGNDEAPAKPPAQAQSEDDDFEGEDLQRLPDNARLAVLQLAQKAKETAREQPKEDDAEAKAEAFDPDDYDQEEIDNMTEDDLPSTHMFKNKLIAGEWVRQIVPYADAPAIVIDETYRDGFELPDALSQGGRHASYDHRWEAPGENSRSADIAHDLGFRPAKMRNGEFDETSYETDSDGTVRKGSLVLWERPKELSERRAVELAMKNARRLGEEIEDFLEPEFGDKERLNEDYGQFFVDQAKTNGSVHADNAATLLQQAQARQAEDIEIGANRAKGRKSFGVHVPWGRDLVQERHGKNVSRNHAVPSRSSSTGARDRVAEALGQIGAR